MKLCMNDQDFVRGMMEKGWEKREGEGDTYRKSERDLQGK